MGPGNFIVYTLVASQQLREEIDVLAWSGGFRPVVLGSARDFLWLPEPRVPACLILGVDLPDMSGPELQARIGTEGPSIIFVSKQADVRQSVSAMKAGAVDFLLTPIDARELVRAIHLALDLDKRRRVARARYADLERRYSTLTVREREIFALITEGMLNKQVAAALGISPMTVQIHRGRIVRKLEARSFAELVRFADALEVGRRTGQRGGATLHEPGILNASPALSLSGGQTRR